MTPRGFLGAVIFPLALLAAFSSLEKSTAKADGMRPAAEDQDHQPPRLLAEIHIREPSKSLTFESISSSGMVVYQAEFGRGYVDFSRTSLGRDGKAEFHAFHMRY
jgi:hypothetical protein